MRHPPIDSQITFLYTDDLAQTAHFYERTIGLQLKLDQGACKIYQVSGDGYLGFCRQPDGGESKSDPPRVILTIVTDNVDEWYSYLGNQNAHLEKQPAVNPEFDIYHFFVRDPNGYLLEIQQFLHPF
jgi:catechol 2,3-dioxygenase-like lactoylglutathione lyase family enzyme